MGPSHDWAVDPVVIGLSAEVVAAVGSHVSRRLAQDCLPGGNHRGPKNNNRGQVPGYKHFANFCFLHIC
jgi:hypothetical protein